MGSGKLIVNFKEVEGRTISLDPEKGLMVDGIVIDPKYNNENYLDVKKNEQKIETLSKEKSLKTVEVNQKRKNRQKLFFTLFGVIFVIGTSVLVLKGMKQNDS